MFKIMKSEQEVLSHLSKRTSEIMNLSKLPNLDNFYLAFLAKYEGIVITPDIDIFGYENALKENKYLAVNYSDISKTLWIIGRTGQGDEWFMNKDAGNVLFYDHNQGEYSNNEQFIDFSISFLEFLQMSFLYQDLENLLDRKRVSESEISAFIRAVDSIHLDLYELYPFKYF